MSPCTNGSRSIRSYQSFDEPSFCALSVVPNQSGSELAAPFTLTEVQAAILHQKSRATGLNGTSPIDMKSLCNELAPLLVPIFNAVLERGSFPSQWTSSVFFFLHKKGAMNDPSNYRSIAVEDPVLKIFSTAIYSRLFLYLES